MFITGMSEDDPQRRYAMQQYWKFTRKYRSIHGRKETLPPEDEESKKAMEQAEQFRIKMKQIGRIVTTPGVKHDKKARTKAKDLYEEALGITLIKGVDGKMRKMSITEKRIKAIKTLEGMRLTIPKEREKEWNAYATKETRKFIEQHNQLIDWYKSGARF